MPFDILQTPRRGRSVSVCDGKGGRDERVCTADARIEQGHVGRIGDSRKRRDILEARQPLVLFFDWHVVEDRGRDRRYCESPNASEAPNGQG